MPKQLHPNFLIGDLIENFCLLTYELIFRLLEKCIFFKVITMKELNGIGTKCQPFYLISKRLFNYNENFIKFLMIKFLFYIRDFELDLVSIWEDSKLLQEWFYFSYTTLKGSKYQSTNFIQKLKSLSDNPTSQQEFMTLIQP